MASRIVLCRVDSRRSFVPFGPMFQLSSEPWNNLNPKLWFCDRRLIFGALSVRVSLYGCCLGLSLRFTSSVLLFLSV